MKLYASLRDADGFNETLSVHPIGYVRNIPERRHYKEWRETESEIII